MMDEPLTGKNLIDLVRYAMTSGLAPEQAAKKIGVEYKKYGLTRKLLLLKARPVMTDQEKEKINYALQCLEENRVTDARVIARPIITKHWEKKTINGVAIRKAKRQETVDRKLYKRLEKTLFAIREACTNNEEMKIPDNLEPEIIQGYNDILMESVTALGDLFRKLKEGKKE